jgi:hypothetical protein
MDITRIIQDLLYRDNSISIPGLGTLSLIYIPSEIYRISNRITPPSHRIDFTENFDASNNSLVYVLSEEYDLSPEEAKEAINDWFNEAKVNLNKGKSISLKNIGTLREVSGVLIFEADKDSPLTASNYGLESVNMPLMELEAEKPEAHIKVISPVKHKFFNKKLKWIAALIAVIIFISAGFVAYNMGYLDEAINKLSVLTSFNNFPDKQQLATNDTLTGKIDANKLKREALRYSEFQKSQKAISIQKLKTEQKNLKYYIIAGSFKTFKSANRFKNELVMNGFSPEILNIGDTTFRVSLASFNSRQKAVEEYIMLTARDANRKIWLYSQLVEK